MSDIAIRVEGLGKLYRIGQPQAYGTLREAVMTALKAPLVALQRGGQLRSRADDRAKTVWALKNISFTAKRGEVVGIIGRNGAGKSTLLKILSRITEPTEGYAEIYGRVGSLLEVGTGFHPELTGRENIYLNGAILGMKKAEIERKFDEIVSFAEVERFIDTPVKRYSSGMFMRLAFSVAAHLDPEILLVDEVLAVGDLNYQRKCITKMQELANEQRAVLFVSHNMSTVNLVAKRAILMNCGRIDNDGAAPGVIAAFLDQIHADQVQAMGENVRVPPKPPSESSTPCKIVGVDLLDEAGNRTSSFQSRGKMRVRIHYNADTPVPQPYFGVTLWTEDGVRVATLDSRSSADSRAGEICGDGAVECIIPDTFLLAGTYAVRVRIFDSKTGWPYDSFGWDDGKASPFYVITGQHQRLILNRDHGIVELPVIWQSVV